METKKTPRADLKGKSSFIFSISLLITMSIIVFAFEMKQYDDAIIIEPKRGTDLSEEIIPPITEVKKPEPRKEFAVVIEATEDPIEVELTPSIDAELEPEPELPPVVAQPVDVEEHSEDIMLFPEESAAPKGGMDAFYQYVGEKIKYPAQATRMGVEGKVFVEFVINKDGSITDVRTMKGIGAGCDEEAMRVIREAPRWSPGKQRGKAVRQRMVLPITFRIN